VGIADLDIRIVHAATGEILRRLTLDPTRDYQPTGKPGPTPTQTNTARTQRGFGLSAMSRDITVVEVMGFEPTTSSMRPKRSSQLSYTP
jgi:hypothetical protein